MPSMLLPLSFLDSLSSKVVLFHRSREGVVFVSREMFLLEEIYLTFLLVVLSPQRVIAMEFAEQLDESVVGIEQWTVDRGVQRYWRYT